MLLLDRFARDLTFCELLQHGNASRCIRVLQENEDAERLVNASQIFTRIFPGACLRIPRGNLRMARVCEERSIPRHIISAQFRRSVYIIRVRLAADRVKAAVSYAFLYRQYLC